MTLRHGLLALDQSLTVTKVKTRIRPHTEAHETLITLIKQHLHNVYEEEWREIQSSS